MAVLSSPPCSPCHHRAMAAAAPLPAPTAASARRQRRASLRLAAAGARSGVTAAPEPRPTLADRRRCECFDLHRQLVPFGEAYSWQKSIVERRKKLKGSGEDHSDTLIALQHPPVYTLGTDSKLEYLHFNKEEAPFELHHIDRGGEVTYHGPGQLVMYPIMNLKYHKDDVHWYLRSLEEVIIRALKSAFFIKATRVKDFTGVWVGDEKVAAIGIHGSRKIVYHGLALNVTTDLAPFKMIDPCGIKDRGVGSVKEILLKASGAGEIDDASLMDIAYDSMIKEFAELFQVTLYISYDCSFW